MTTKTAKAPSPKPTTPRQECAIRIAAGILAGPSGERILKSKDADAIVKLARLSIKFADVIFAEAA